MKKDKFYGTFMKILQVSKQLPFLEYNLHSRLLNKMRMKGMNAIFNLRVRITVGDTMTLAIAVRP
jgi:hypothetical protein